MQRNYVSRLMVIIVKNKTETPLYRDEDGTPSIRNKPDYSNDVKLEIVMLKDRGLSYRQIAQQVPGVTKSG
jgi:hypothetical protein